MSCSVVRGGFCRFLSGLEWLDSGFAVARSGLTVAFGKRNVVF